MKTWLPKRNCDLVKSFENLLKARFPDHQLFEKKQMLPTTIHTMGKDTCGYLTPLTGTDNFQSGIPVWGVSVALLENFWPVFGVFHMPATGDLFHARADGKAYRGTKQISIPTRNTVDDEMHTPDLFALSSGLHTKIPREDKRPRMYLGPYLLCSHRQSRCGVNCE